jgi:NADH:ubiquinone oxidoreductase subunit 5 (subunit L)/multisubunit Na+/H+ antiporter MnhA subunit
MFCFPLLTLFLSFILNGSFIGRYIGHRGSKVISISLCFITLISSIMIWYEVIYGGCEAYINIFGTWISVGSMNINWDVYYDILSVHMLLTVSVVSFAVHCYSMVYMRSDPHLNLFISYLSLFTFFMVVLVSANNMLGMFIGFEGIGVCSYLLIGYWSHRLAASKSALKAIVVNRISDGLLLWSIIWLWWYTGTLEYDLILLNDSNNISSFLSIALLLGCMANFDLAHMHLNNNYNFIFIICLCFYTRNPFIPLDTLSMIQALVGLVPSSPWPQSPIFFCKKNRVPSWDMVPC